MTFPIFKNRMLAAALALAATLGSHAQESQMQALINQSLSKLQQAVPADGASASVSQDSQSGDAFLTCIAELKRIDAMFPDSILPKYQTALQSLNFAVAHPHASQTESLLTETAQTISLLEHMKGTAPNEQQHLSDVFTLRGFLYMVRIVQDPAQNGRLYYLDVMQNYEKALRLNPDNALAQHLQQKFHEGMRQATGRP